MTSCLSFFRDLSFLWFLSGKRIVDIDPSVSFLFLGSHVSNTFACNAQLLSRQTSSKWLEDTRTHKKTFVGRTHLFRFIAGFHALLRHSFFRRVVSSFQDYFVRVTIVISSTPWHAAFQKKLSTHQIFHLIDEKIQKTKSRVLFSTKRIALKSFETIIWAGITCKKILSQKSVEFGTPLKYSATCYNQKTEIFLATRSPTCWKKWFLFLVSTKNKQGVKANL